MCEGNRGEGTLRSMEFCIEPGFDWANEVGAEMGCDWCPATHYGFCKQGTLVVKRKDADDLIIKAGDTYFLGPGHIPTNNGPETVICVEFSQDPSWVPENR